MATMATPQPQPPPPPQRRPRKIRPLPKDVVDRIAAGEVVQRPVSVVKELLENSLDADGTQIDIQIQAGGLSSISVTDNGHGISPRDLPLACTRFATSKLVEADDLKSIRTFGFRGEALASASMVARVGIISRVRPRNSKKKSVGVDCSSSDDDGARHQNCAYKMQYSSGKPCPKTHPQSKPKPSAGREGTVIQVQDLFYNIPSRRRALEGSKRAEREEYERILAVVQRYAVHEAKRGVGFLCRGGNKGSKAGGGGKGKKGGKKSGFGGGNHTDLNTQSLSSVKKIQERRKRRQQGSRQSSSSAATQQQSSTEDEQIAATKDVIGHIFGTAVTRELLPLKSGEGDVESVSLASLKAMEQQKDGSGNSSSVLDNADAARIGNEESNNDFSNSLLEEMMLGAGVNEGVHTTPLDDASQQLNGTSHNDAKSPNAQQQQQQSTSKYAFAYRATGLITNSSYSCPKSSSAFLLFINDRLVESTSLRRAVDSVYADTLPKGGKPFVYLSLELPGPHVDVNVHPTKREVAMLHEERLCDAVSKAVREVVGSATSSRTFSVATGGRLLPKEKNDDDAMARSKKLKDVVAGMEGPLLLDKESESVTAPLEESMLKDDGKENTLDVDAIAQDDRNFMALTPATKTKNAETNNDDNIGDDAADESELQHQQPESDKKAPKKRAAADDIGKSTTVRNPYDPSRLVRTSRTLPIGALEPFLVKKEPKVKAEAGTDNPSASASSQANMHNASTIEVIQHKPGCPLANNNQSGQKVDMSMPGAFASAICRCQVERAESLPPAPTNGIVVRKNINSNNVVRPKKITPTHCDLDSINGLREEIINSNDQSLNETLRDSTYVGAISRSRSLLQSGIDLIMINHRALSRGMFYQIALLKFGSMPMAKLGGGGVDVLAAIGQMFQFEEDLNGADDDKISGVVKVSKTNSDMARQATTCLEEKAPMLEEYFSIKFEKVNVYIDNQKRQRISSLRITGLPILLDGHSPQPHGLPLFLLRLATEVNWTEEQLCFKGICTELATFYSELPFASAANDDESNSRKDNPDFIDDEAKRYVKHTLFPAISFLLVPPKDLSDNGAVIKLADLKSMYRVFERC